MRSDGIKVHDDQAMYELIPHFLTTRNDAMNMVTVDIPEEPLRLYMNEKRKSGVRISHLALIICAYNRVIAEFPKLNRFISGNRKIFQHKDVTVSMVVLRPASVDDTMSKVVLDPTDTIFDVQNKMDQYIAENRKPQDNGLDGVMRFFIHLPLLMNFVLGMVRFLDKHGMLPKALIKVSPFHASFLISNLASIRTNHIYHHVYNFGTTSVGITMGNMRYIPHVARDGSVVVERCLPLGVVMDERICSGHYFALAFARMKEYLRNPALLETPYCPPADTAE